MPTFIDLQQQNVKVPVWEPEYQYGEEVIADARAGLTPSQLVDRKLESRKLSEVAAPRIPAIRPRAK